MIELVFMGAPVAKGRPRFGDGRTYTPAKTLKAENDIQTQAKTQGVRRLEGALGILIAFHMPIPESWSKKRRSEAVGGYHISRPDADNLKKLVLDALNGLAWDDDSQVAYSVCSKVYSDTPRTEVQIWQLPVKNSLQNK